MNSRSLAVGVCIASSFLTRFAQADDAKLANAAESKNAAQVRKLLDAKADVNAAQADGMSALHWAAYHDDAEAVKQLLAAGANANAANRYGVTPLSIACTNGNTAVVTAL